MSAFDPILAWFRRQDVVLLGSVVLAVWYTAAYLGHSALPGNNPTYPAGWWGYWDQSYYLKSAIALSRHNFDPAEHLYPLGYPLLGSLFVRPARMHAFYFIDLASLVIALIGFVGVAGRCGVARRWAVLLFILATCADATLFAQWIVPWTTTPVAAVIWVLLALGAAHIAGERHPALLGLAAVCLPMLRPTDLLLALPALATCWVVDLRRRRGRWRDLASFAAAGLIPAGLYGLLYVRIYGFHPSLYLTMSKDIGFTLHHIGWKAYVILVDPRPWFGGGEGLLRRAPWMILGVAGLLPALRRPITLMLAVTLAIHSLLYISYVDLLPTGLWRFFNVHYWVWAFPGFALLAVGLVTDLLAPRRRWLAVGSLAFVVALLCIQLVPAPATEGAAIDALDYTVADAPFDKVYFSTMTVQDDLGMQRNIHNVRSITLPGKIRVLALTRSLHGDIAVTGNGLEGLTPQRLTIAARLGIPFWPWTRPDRAFGPP